VTDDDRAQDVRPRVVPEAVAGGGILVVKRLLLGRALRVNDRLERLVLDADPLGRATRLLGVLGRDERDRFAEIADAVDREDGLVGELEAVRLRARHVGVGEDGVDAGHRHRLRVVDLRDPSMRVGAAQRVAPEHSRGEEVARVGELPRHLGHGVRAPDALADAPELELPSPGRLYQPVARRCGHPPPSAARRTASKIFA
jgi:hypothetical protein